MTQQIINVGELPNDGEGDPLRVAFQKVNENFQQVFTTPGAAGSDGSFQYRNLNTLTSASYHNMLWVVAGRTRWWQSVDAVSFDNSEYIPSSIISQILGISTGFIAVGDDSTILTSADGLNWSARTPAEAANFTSIAQSSSGRFVAVGAAGKIQTSLDAITWTTVSSGSSADLSSITYSSLGWVAVGAAGTILFSNNATTWTVVSPISSVTLNSVVYDGSFYVAVGDAGFILKSPDGIIWTPVVTSIIDDLNGIATGTFEANTITVVVGNSGALYRSVDSSNIWTIPSSYTRIDSDLASVSRYNNIYIAVGKNGSVLTSPDGDIWSNVSMPGIVTGSTQLQYDEISNSLIMNSSQMVISSNVDINTANNSKTLSIGYTSVANVNIRTETEINGKFRIPVYATDPRSSVSDGGDIFYDANNGVIKWFDSIHDQWKTVSNNTSISSNMLINGNNTVTLDSTGNTIFTGSILPSNTLLFDLGSSSQRFKDLYLSSNTIYLGNSAMSVSNGVIVLDGTYYASENYVNNAIVSVIGTPPTALDSLEKIANSINNNSDFYSWVNNELDLKANTINLANVAISGSYNDLIDVPVLANVAISGSYNDLTNKPTIQGVPIGGTVGQVLAKIDDTDYNTEWVTPTSGSGTLDSVTDAGSTTTNSITVGSVSLTNGTTLTETATTTVITPPTALAGQSLVIRPTGVQGIVSDHPGGFADGDTITITVTPDYGSAQVTGTLDYTFTGATSIQLGRALTGTLTFNNASSMPISWTIPVSSTMTTFTITIGNASGFAITSVDNTLTLTTTGSSEDHHIHLIAGDPTITDIYLGDDDQYVKIEKNGGNVVIGTDTNTKQWNFGTDGNLTLPLNGDLNFNGGGISQSNDDDLLITTNDGDGIASSSVLMSPGDTLTRLEQWSEQDSDSWNTSDWSTGVYTTQGGLGAVEFTGAANIVNIVNSLVGVGHIFFSVNGGPLLVYDGASSGATDITFYTPTLPATDPTVVTTFEYFYSYKSGFEIDYDSAEVNIYANDADINLQTTNQRDISLDSSGDVIITANSASTWIFGSDGTTFFPDGTNFGEINGTGTIGFAVNPGSEFTIDTTGGSWSFGNDGSLTLPIGVSIDNSVSPLYPKIIADSGKLFSVQGQGNSGSAALAWTVDPNAASQYAAVNVSRGGGDNLAKVVLQAQSDSGEIETAKTWKFDETGTLTLPADSAIDEAIEIVTVTLDQFTDGGYPGTQMFTKVSDTLYELSPTGPYMTLISGIWRLKIGPSTYYDSTDLITWSPIAGGLPAPVGTLATLATMNLTVNDNTWAFDADGNLTLPDGGDIIRNGVSVLPEDAVIKGSGSWTVTPGTNNYSITLDQNSVYNLWIRGNIPNGIITYVATISITNSNVPVIGTQYAWNYTGGGSPILLTSIPTQIIGTEGAISTDVVIGTVNNVFNFGISNTTGSNQTVNWGYTKIS